MKGGRATPMGGGAEVAGTSLRGRTMKKGGRVATKRGAQ